MNESILEAVAVDFDGTYVMGKPLVFIYQENKERFLEKQGMKEAAAKEAENWKKLLELMHKAETPDQWAKVVKMWQEQNPTINKDWIPDHLPINQQLVQELKKLKLGGTRVYLISVSPKELIKGYFDKSRDNNVDFDEIYGTVGNKVKLIKELNCQRYYTDWSPDEKRLKEDLGIEVINVEEEFNKILDYNHVEVSYPLNSHEIDVLNEALEHYQKTLMNQQKESNSDLERNKINEKLRTIEDLKKKIEK